MNDALSPSPAAASAIAERYNDPATAPIVSKHRATSQSLANGAAGTALLHIERARTGPGDWNRAHAWLSATASDDISAGDNACLYFGAPALAFLTHRAAEYTGRYQQAFDRLHDATLALTRTRLRCAHARIDRADRPRLAEFDLIRGLTGLGAYHLHVDPHHEMTSAVLSYLVRLTQPLLRNSDGLPGWWTYHGPTGQPMVGGHGNFGVAHGIAGPLALLALAMRRGITVSGQADAIQRICIWLDAWQQDHHSGPWWPRIVSLDEVRTYRPGQSRPSQPSWCYGTPGLARAQQLAGIATGDPDRQTTAEGALLGCLTDRTQRDQLTEPGLCHGTAGLLHTTRCMATDASTPCIADHLSDLSTRLLAQLPPETQDSTLLEGETGAALALHTTTVKRSVTSWDSCLLLT